MGNIGHALWHRRLFSKQSLRSRGLQLFLVCNTTHHKYQDCQKRRRIWRPLGSISTGPTVCPALPAWLWRRVASCSMYDGRRDLVVCKTANAGCASPCLAHTVFLARILVHSEIHALQCAALSRFIGHHGRRMSGSCSIPAKVQTPCGSGGASRDYPALYIDLRLRLRGTLFYS